MKLIVLYGPEDSGKTTTLEMVYERLKRINIKDTHCFWYLDEIQRDFIDVLVIDKTRLGDAGCNPPMRTSTTQPEPIKIGIVTQGDYVRGSNAIDDHLQFLLKENCEIAICPCSEIPATTTPKDKIDAFVSANKGVVSIVDESHIKPYSNEMEIANKILIAVKNNC